MININKKQAVQNKNKNSLGARTCKLILILKMFYDNSILSTKGHIIVVSPRQLHLKTIKNV